MTHLLVLLLIPTKYLSNPLKNKVWKKVNLGWRLTLPDRPLQTVCKLCRPRSTECGVWSGSTLVCYSSSNILNTSTGSRTNYRIQSNYHTYLYKHIVKQFRSLQATVHVFCIYFFIKAYVVGTHKSWGNSNSTHSICSYEDNQKQMSCKHHY